MAGEGLALEPKPSRGSAAGTIRAVALCTLRGAQAQPLTPGTHACTKQFRNGIGQGCAGQRRGGQRERLVLPLQQPRRSDSSMAKPPPARPTGLGWVEVVTVLLELSALRRRAEPAGADRFRRFGAAPE